MTAPLDGVGTANAIRRGEIKVVEVVEAALRRIDELDDDLGAFTVTFPDPFFDDWAAMSLPANLAGLPATSVPAGFGTNSMPVGLQFMGPRFADVRTLAGAGAFEKVRSWSEFVPGMN